MGTPAATPLPSSSPAPSTSASVSMGSDGSDRTVDGTDSGSSSSTNTVVIGAAVGVGAVALAVGAFVVRSKKKKSTTKKGTIAPSLAPATRLKAGRPSVDGAAGDQRVTVMEDHRLVADRSAKTDAGTDAKTKSHVD